VKLSYNIHNKEFLAIFETSKIWHYYLKSLSFSIKVIIVMTLAKAQAAILDKG